MSSVDVFNLRQHPRFLFAQSLPAVFNGTQVRVLNASGGGVQIAHAEPIKVGVSGTFRISADALLEETSFRARVMWSRLSNVAGENGKLLYRSGLHIDEDAPVEVLGFLGRLIRTLGTPDTASLERKRQAMIERQKPRAPRSPQSVMKYTQAQLLAIQQGRTYLARNEWELFRLYEAAKVSLAQKKLPVMHKREVLAIWKYLGETIDLDLIAAVLAV